MRRLAYLLLIVFALLAAGAAYVFYTESGQDAFFARAAGAALSPTPDDVEGLRVVICGSASPLGNDPKRAQACIAVLTPDHFFLFDVGARSPLRMAQAGLPMNRLSGVFLTHFHSDHIAALPDVNLATWVRGRREPLAVYGPRGVEDVVAGFNRAYRLDRGYRTAHHGTELLPPSAGPMQAEAFDGGVVWQDEDLTVTAFTVPHPPIEPAVGYRVDYRGRSVVISGDCNASDPLFTAAKNADLVLHDALSRTLLDPMIAAAEARNVPVMPTIMRDVISYHADATTLPERAKAAGVKQLAYYHLVPVPANALAERMFRRGLPDDVLLVEDLHRFDMPIGSTEINITAP